MKNLVLFIAMLATGVCGYLLGSWGGRGAKDALARVETSAKESQSRYEQSAKALQDKLATLNSEHEQATRKLKDELAQQQATFDGAVASRDQRIQDLLKSRAGIQSEIAKAQARLAASRSDDEKKAAQADIGKLQRQEQAVAVTVAGEQCAGVQVPPSLLMALRGAAQ